MLVSKNKDDAIVKADLISIIARYFLISVSVVWVSVLLLSAVVFLVLYYIFFCFSFVLLFSEIIRPSEYCYYYGLT